MNIEHNAVDTLGSVVAADGRLWGVQTQSALRHFAISTERMPDELIVALAAVKLACAKVSGRNGALPRDRAHAIAAAALEVMNGSLLEEFPLSVWQTGSATQTNMNMNEVLANRATNLLVSDGQRIRPVHPNDDVNLAQSSNDVIPTAIHVAAAHAITTRLLPRLGNLLATVQAKASEFADDIKVGRTHLQDATPVTLGQEFSGYAAQLTDAKRSIQQSVDSLCPLAIGGTAVGTGLNSPINFGIQVASELAAIYALPLTSANNKFAAIAAHDALVFAHGCLRTLAIALIKIATDVRWMASGPRAGLGEINLPANEPGSSMMPGKVNPTQCEALTMLCYQVMANDVAIGLGGAAGNFELNVCKPLIAHNFLQSVRLLADGMHSFETHCLCGITANRSRMAQGIEQTLMLATALVPHIGYDRAARVVRAAQNGGTTLREAALQSEHIQPDDFDRWVQPSSMLEPGVIPPVTARARQ